MKSLRRASSRGAIVALVAIPFTAALFAQTDAPVTAEEASAALREFFRTSLDATLVAPKTVPLPRSLDPAIAELRRKGDRTTVDRLAAAWSDAVTETLPHTRSAAAALATRFKPRDPLAIVAGGDDAATEYFRGANEDAIARAIQPTVRDAIGHSRLAEAYRVFTAQLSASAIDAPALRPADLERAVTDAALREVFRELAGDEAKLRRDPAAGSEAIRRTFGAARAP